LARPRELFQIQEACQHHRIATLLIGDKSRFFSSILNPVYEHYLEMMFLKSENKDKHGKCMISLIRGIAGITSLIVLPKT
jgi:hypothetical protein